MIREVAVVMVAILLAFFVIWFYGAGLEPMADEVGACDLPGYGGEKLCNDLEFVFQVAIPLILVGGSVIFSVRRAIRRQRATLGAVRGGR